MIARLLRKIAGRHRQGDWLAAAMFQASLNGLSQAPEDPVLEMEEAAGRAFSIAVRHGRVTHDLGPLQAMAGIIETVLLRSCWSIERQRQNNERVERKAGDLATPPA